MAKLPSGFRTNISVHPINIGPAKRKELLDRIADKSTYLPRGVLEEDMDSTFIKFVEDDLALVIDGERIPVIFLTLQRFTQFSKTWEFTDEFQDIKLPFVTIVRHPDIQEGTNQAGLWNIAGEPTYAYMDVPTWDGSRNGVDTYRIPQPIAMDISYEVRLFTNRMRDLNTFNRKIKRKFQSRQYYIYPNGHPMPLHLDGTGDDSSIEDFEDRRFYVNLFEITLLGYVMDESEFKVMPSINRIGIGTTPVINQEE